MNRIDTCYGLSWTISKKWKRTDGKETITCIAHDPDFEKNVPEFFKLAYNDYAMGGIYGFDLDLSRALRSYS